MSRIRGKDTKPELVVRRLVHALGYRYRLHGLKLPGRPDLVFPARKKVILVHGCFWHRHTCKLGRPKPKTRPEFWATKFEGNVRRDAENERKLRANGWEVMIVWQCELDDLEKISRRLGRFLGNRSREAAHVLRNDASGVRQARRG